MLASGMVTAETLILAVSLCQFFVRKYATHTGECTEQKIIFRRILNGKTDYEDNPQGL